MPCYFPIEAHQPAGGGPLSFSERRGFDKTIHVPCGRCIGCRLERSRQWAVRVMHEASMHDENSFITLTYRPEDLPPLASLRYSDFQLFMKRLRKVHKRVRFYMCGEYGEEGPGIHPHFHACIFGTSFPDRVFFKAGLWRSAVLERLWPFGFSSVGELTFESAAYVARYCTQKVTGSLGPYHYSRVNEDTGEVVRVEPEFNHMSLKPGVGAGWFKRYHTDVFPHDHVIVNGQEAKPPRYYDKLYKAMNRESFESIQLDRIDRAERAYKDATPVRLEVRHQVAQSRASISTRKGYK